MKRWRLSSVVQRGMMAPAVCRVQQVGGKPGQPTWRLSSDVQRGVMVPSCRFPLAYATDSGNRKSAQCTAAW